LAAVEKTLCRSVWEDDARTGAEIDAFFAPVEEAYLSGFAWRMVNRTTYADTMPGGVEDCRVVSHVYYGVPRLVYGRPVNLIVVVSYYTGDLALGESTPEGPSFSEAEEALDSAIAAAEGDVRFKELLDGGFDEMSYAYEEDTLTVSGADYEVYFMFGGGPQRSHYPPQRNRMMTYYLYGLYGFPEVTASREKAGEALEQANQERNLSCQLSFIVVTDTFNMEDDGLHVVSWRLNDSDGCPCRIEVTLREGDGRLAYVGQKTLYPGPRGCP